ncbi:hypothetical protein JOC78_002880 [Bacillus ectoiniformans]|uniref:hypothetical protein n=1 Tax=Bacillus ectoiniformans TaxID=1494429 RepID=UPI001957204E|nr:hypothetical protein [Bacillus ectoiniformans]MBM7649896.1 hypothetical protein [Bacillus ectoiniformans]
MPISISDLAEKATEQIYKREPQLLERFGEQGKNKCKEDNEHHLKQLKTAFELDNHQFFVEYAIWLNGILTKHGMGTKHLVDNFQILEGLLKSSDQLEENELNAYLDYIDRAIRALDS